MHSSEIQLLNSFEETLHYLSKYTRDAYHRDLNYLQNYTAHLSTGNMILQ